MTKMTDARAVEVLAAHNEWRRGGDGPQTEPVTLGLALDHVISRMGEPAEAQAQGGGEVVQEHYEHFLAYSGLSDNVWLRYAYFHGADIGLDRPERPAKVLRFDKRDFDHSIEVYEDGYYVSHDDYLAALYTAPPSAPVGVEAAEAMGARGGPASESERLAFEAWMRGHCWPLCATWDGTGYRSDAEQGGRHCPDAARTRGLWAAWRDRAALAQQPAAVDGATEPLFYLQDSRSYVGNCPLWWCPDGMGYTTRLDEAGRFTRDYAMSQCRSRGTDVPWPCEQIDAIRRPTVDMQDMRALAQPQGARNE